MYNGPGVLPNTGMAAGPLALLFDGATAMAYVLLGISLVAGGFVLMRARAMRTEGAA